MIFPHWSSAILVTLSCSVLVSAGDEYADYCPGKDGDVVTVDGTEYTIKCDGWYDQLLTSTNYKGGKMTPEDCARQCTLDDECLAAARIDDNKRCWVFKGPLGSEDSLEDTVLLIRGITRSAPPPAKSIDDLEKELEACDQDKTDFQGQASQCDTDKGLLETKLNSCETQKKAKETEKNTCTTQKKALEQDFSKCQQGRKDAEAAREDYKKKWEAEMKKHAAPPPPPSSHSNPPMDSSSKYCNSRNHNTVYSRNRKKYKLQYQIDAVNQVSSAPFYSTSKFSGNMLDCINECASKGKPCKAVYFRKTNQYTTCSCYDAPFPRIGPSTRAGQCIATLA